MRPWFDQVGLRSALNLVGEISESSFGQAQRKILATNLSLSAHIAGLNMSSVFELSSGQ